MRLRVSLPKDLQARLIRQELGQNDFLSLVRQIVDEHIQISQQVLSESARKKPAKKAKKKT